MKQTQKSGYLSYPIKERQVRSGFGISYVQSNWSDEDWDNYHFNLNLRDSIYYKAMMESRKTNRDEKQFIDELEVKQDLIRSKYMSKKEMLGIE